MLTFRKCEGPAAFGIFNESRNVLTDPKNGNNGMIEEKSRILEEVYSSNQTVHMV